MSAPIVLSLKIAALSTLLCLIFGTLLARITMNQKRLRAVVDYIVLLPMVFPPTVTGFLLLRLFSKHGFLGSLLERLDISVIFTFTGAVIAATVVAFPLMYRTALGAFLSIDQEILSAARTLGVSEMKLFFFILLPNTWQGIFSGTILTFARALGEFGATIILAGNIPGKTQTMAIAIYQAVINGKNETAFTYVMVMLFLSLFSLLLMNVCMKGNKR